MIITKTPFRISFFGGGTDFPDFFTKFGGKVLSTSIDKYCYVTIRHLSKFFEYKNEIIYSKIEQVKDVSSINHPMVRNALKFFDIDNIRVTYDADLPARSGLGSSSSFAVGLVNALAKLKNINLTKKEFADIAIHIEKEMCMEDGGIQDQIAASFGGLNLLNFEKNIDFCDTLNINSYEFLVNSLNINKEKIKKLENNLMLFFTGISRNSFEIQKETQKSIEKNINNLLFINDIVDEAVNILTTNKDIDLFGKLLNETWKLKKSLHKNISNNYIDDLYETGIKNGAIGGKLLGAGGGGFILFYVREENKKNIKDIFKNLVEVPIKFENDGTNVIYNSKD